MKNSMSFSLVPAQEARDANSQPRAGKRLPGPMQQAQRAPRMVHVSLSPSSAGSAALDVLSAG